MAPPLIAVSPNHLPPADRRLYQGKALEYGEAELASAIARAGGHPVLLYRANHDLETLPDWADALMARVDGLVLSGGQDIGPEVYGDALADPNWVGDPHRDTFELALYRAALRAHKPVLGVCRGAQLIGVAEGGTLWQDLPSLRGAQSPTLTHRDQPLYDRLTHPLVFEHPFIAGLFDGEPYIVNSVHHQALREVPPSLTVLATAPDGVPECYVRSDAWVLAIQWHPEWMDTASSRRLFGVFIAACSGDRALPW